MAASDQILLVMDCGTPVTAFTSKPELRAYLRYRRDMLRNPLIYTFANGHGERAVPADAVAVHGLTAEFLADKPPFDHVADDFLAFVGDAPLVAHNAGFDIAFLNAEAEARRQAADCHRARD